MVNPETSDKLAEYAKIYVEMRAQKGNPVSEEEALKTMKDPLYYGALMVHQGVADGSVAGAINTTGAVITAASRVIGMKPGIKTASSFFMMVLKDQSFGYNGVLIYADCALIPNPDAATLADIAISTARSAQQLVGLTPQIAMLSFSTKGSGKHEDVDKVQEAPVLPKRKRLNCKLMGNYKRMRRSSRRLEQEKPQEVRSQAKPMS